jgi:predicted CoA-binding protein
MDLGGAGMDAPIARHGSGATAGELQPPFLGVRTIALLAGLLAFSWAETIGDRWLTRSAAVSIIRHCQSRRGRVLMIHDTYPDYYINDILRSTKTIALVGASPNTERPSYRVMAFLLRKGYTVYPVNPGQASKEIQGQTVYATLADLPEPVDMVDVFRAADALPSLIDEILKLKHLPKAIWGQLAVRDDNAAAKAEERGIKVVMDRCPAIEYPRLIG